MKRGKKIVLVELNLGEWLPLSRYAASKKKSIRSVAKNELMPFIKQLKKTHPQKPIQQKPSIDDIH